MRVLRILLADDSDLILQRLHERISTCKGVETIGSFTNGTETLEALRILKPDLAIVDIKMPGLSGLQVLKEIRKEDKALKFIILTLYTSDNYRQLAIQNGADFFFSKVDDFDKIPQVIKEMELKL
jgi:DNA-binding NarL/FixJ family response regulator